MLFDLRCSIAKAEEFFERHEGVSAALYVDPLDPRSNAELGMQQGREDGDVKGRLCSDDEACFSDGGEGGESRDVFQSAHGDEDVSTEARPADRDSQSWSSYLFGTWLRSSRSGEMGLISD